MHIENEKIGHHRCDSFSGIGMPGTVNIGNFLMLPDEVSGSVSKPHYGDMRVFYSPP